MAHEHIIMTQEPIIMAQEHITMAKEHITLTKHIWIKALLNQKRSYFRAFEN